MRLLKALHRVDRSPGGRATTSPEVVAEDSELRSRYMRDLVLEEFRVLEPSVTPKIPRVLFQFWHDRSDLPADVCECLRSWEQLKTQGFRRVLFDEKDARRFIERRLGTRYVEAFDLCHHPAMRCDYFRLCYLSVLGGFYVDADEVFQGGDCQSWFRDSMLKIQALCFDTATRTMIEREVFMRKRASSRHWVFYANNNPIIAPASHPVVSLALSRATRILLSRAELRPEIQSTTGPGNLTASLVSHSIALKRAGSPRDFVLLADWDARAISSWPLSYRNDERNWRLWQFLNAGGAPPDGFTVSS